MPLEHQGHVIAVHSTTGALALDAPLGSVSRPTWRGLVHTLALLAAIPLLVRLSIVSNGARSRAAVIVYATGLCSMFAVSSVYHRWVHSLRARAIWRRADHATIFAAIAGTFTPLALSTLGTRAAIAVLIAIRSARWNRMSLTPAPVAAAVQIAISIAIAAPVPSVLNASAVNVPAIAAKIVAWSARRQMARARNEWTQR